MLFVQTISFFFIQLVLGGLFQWNRHLLILDRHGSHVTLEVIEQAYEVGLDMITLPSHTFHTLQPLNVSYFRPFKSTFRKERYESMFRNTIENQTRLH
jgi:hypothetical protein